MRRAVALFAAAFCAAGCGGGADAAGGGALRFERARTELGTLYGHEERPFSVPFTIEGDGPVRVDLIDTSCGCTDVRLVVDGEALLYAERAEPAAPDPEAEDRSLTARAERLIELAPGTRGEILGTFRAERKLGERLVVLTVAGSMLNSPAKTEVKVTILPTFELPKDAGSFGTVLQSALGKDGLAREFEVRAPRAFRVQQWRDVPEGISIEALDGAIESDGRIVQRFRLRLLPTLPVGTPKLGQIVGLTDLGPPLEVTLAWRIVGPATYAPERVQFMNVRNGREHVQQVKIRPTDAARPLPEPTLELLGEVAALCSVALEPLPAAGAEPAGWLAKVRLPQGSAPGVYNGTLRISYPAASGLAPWEMVVYARVQEAR